MANSADNAFHKAKHSIWQIVNAIPKGQIATYGQIAKLAGIPQQSRLVGRILGQLPKNSKLPWHRVINSQGRISNPNPERQRERLEAEGVSVVNGKIRLRSYQWLTNP